MKTVSELIAKAELPPPGHYIVAVSGGVDSIVLLDLLATADRSDWQLRVAHFDHGIRPDSATDRRFVEQLARVHGLPFYSAEGKLGQASEDQARQARYQFLREVQRQCDADAVITAHHLDDRRETSIHNLLRGAGRTGSAPLLSINDLRRPLLKISKAELLEYAKHRGLPWREDSTNRDVAISRNFIRHELLPSAREQLDGFDDKYDLAVAGLTELNQRIDSQLQRLLETRAEISSDQISLPRELISELRPKPLEHLLAFALRRLRPGIQLSAAEVSQLARLTKTASAGQQKSLPEGLKADFGYDKVTITFRATDAPITLLPQKLNTQSSLRFGRYQLACGDQGHLLPGSVKVNVDGLVVRGPRLGDRIAPVGLVGTKKLQDLFVDKKISRAERLHYPVVTSYNDEVVWVPGLALSRLHQADDNDPQALILTYELIEGR